MVDGGAYPGGEAGGHVDGGEPGDGQQVPGQHPGDEGGDDQHRHRVGQDVDGLVVPVGQAGDAAHHVQLRPVVGEDVLVEPQMLGHLSDPQQRSSHPRKSQCQSSNHQSFKLPTDVSC